MQGSMNSSDNDILLHAYNSEAIDPGDRCEQAQLYKSESFLVLGYPDLWNDEIEQQENTRPKNSSNLNRF